MSRALSALAMLEDDAPVRSCRSVRLRLSAVARGSDHICGPERALQRGQLDVGEIAGAAPIISTSYSIERVV
jgi:hypothetical protein